MDQASPELWDCLARDPNGIVLNRRERNQRNCGVAKKAYNSCCRIEGN